MISCNHPLPYRLWPSNWEWYCLLCSYKEMVNEGALGKILADPVYYLLDKGKEV